MARRSSTVSLRASPASSDERLGRAPALDQQVGIGEPGVRIGGERQSALEGRFGGRPVAGTLLELGEAGTQPGLRRRGLARV